jgi:hypothetical protein
VAELLVRIGVVAQEHLLADREEPRGAARSVELRIQGRRDRNDDRERRGAVDGLADVGADSGHDAGGRRRDDDCAPRFVLRNLVHILGVATLFGSILVLDLRLLSLWARAPLAAIAAPTVPLATAGFTIAALSGACLIATNATEYFGNPFLLIKFPAIGVGSINALGLGLLSPWRQRRLREPTQRERRQLAIFGAASLVCWLTPIGAGRLIGYW